MSGPPRRTNVPSRHAGANLKSFAPMTSGRPRKREAYCNPRCSTHRRRDADYKPTPRRVTLSESRLVGTSRMGLAVGGPQRHRVMTLRRIPAQRPSIAPSRWSRLVFLTLVVAGLVSNGSHIRLRCRRFGVYSPLDYRSFSDCSGGLDRLVVLGHRNAPFLLYLGCSRGREPPLAS